MCGSNGHTIQPVIHISCPAPTPTATPTVPPPTATPTVPPPTATPTVPPPTATPTVPPPTATPFPTATPIPNSTTLSFVVGLDGIGTTGDRKNPAWQQIPGQPLSGSTQNPAHPERNVVVTLANPTDNSFVGQFNGTIVYQTGDPNKGKFITNPPIDLEQTPSGTYTVYVTTYSHLTKSLGQVDIVAGQNNVVNNDTDAGDLVAGDIVGNAISDIVPNNKLTIEDYNVLISCSIYSKDTSTCALNSDFPKLSDLDDNGTTTTPLINEFDYNLFLRELDANPNGDNVPSATGNTSEAAAEAQVAVEITDSTVATPSGTLTPALTTEPTGTVTPAVTETVTPVETLTPTVTTTPTETTTPTVTTQPTETVTPTVTETVTPSVTTTP
jgi:hypothetical protein